MPRKSSTPRRWKHFKSVSERFWAKVDKRGPDECWPWLAYRQTGDYGRFWNGVTKVGAHQFSFIEANGPITPGMFVLHKCGNGWCVNPAHLYEGTQKQNIADKLLHGTDNRGVKHPLARLTEDDVREIRRLIAEGRMKQVRIAERFGVRPVTITNIKQRKTWRHLDPV